jgi:hypothetical protein
MMRKRLFVPHKSEDGPSVKDIEKVRTTKGKYTNGETFCITDTWNEKGAQRAQGRHWTGTTTFYFHGKASEVISAVKKDDAPTSPSAVVPPAVDTPVVPAPAQPDRKERKYKGSSKPDWIDSHSWVSMSPSVRRHLIALGKPSTVEPAPAVSSASTTTPAAAGVNKRGKTNIKGRGVFDYTHDPKGDLAIEVEKTNGETKLHICLTQDQDIAAGTRWVPKSEMVVRMPKGTWALVIGSVNVDTGKAFNVACDYINDSGPSFFKLVVIAVKCGNVRIQRVHH